MSSVNKPSRWGQTELTRFFDLVRENQHTTFTHFPAACAVLDDIDQAFACFVGDRLNPRNTPLSFLLYRCHVAYRAACGASMAGQKAEAFTLLRSCLEYAACALKLDKDPLALKIWLGQSNDIGSRRAAKTIFQMDRIRPVVAMTDKRLGQIFNILYFRTVKSGAHPNELVVIGRQKTESDGAHRPVQPIYPHGNSPALRHTLRSTADVGLCSLLIFQKISVFAKSFEQLNLNKELHSLRRRVEDMFPRRC